MTERQNSPLGLIILSLFIAVVLQVLPLPAWSTWLRPNWVLLVIAYWIMSMPEKVNVGFAWLIGLVLDGLNGSLLGEHALALVVPAFLMSYWQRRFFIFPVWQQALMIGSLEIVYKLLILIIQGVIGQPPQGLAYWFSVLTTLLLWPWIQAVLTVRQTRTC